MVLWVVTTLTDTGCGAVVRFTIAPVFTSLPAFIIPPSVGSSPGRKA